jgi:hypothetical protein
MLTTLCHALLLFGTGVLASQGDPTQEDSSVTREDWFSPGARLQAWHVSGGDDATALELPRVRLSADGAPGEVLRYKLQLAFEDGPEVKDAELDLVLLPGIFALSIGRRKLPTYREFIASSGRLALVERSILHDPFDGVRGIGVALESEEVAGSGWSYVIGGWTDETSRARFGTSTPPAASDRFTLALAGRISYGTSESRGFDELDLEGGPLRWDIGASAHHSLANDTIGAPGRTREAVDLWLATHHFSAMGSVHMAQAHEEGDGGVWDGVGAQQTVSYVWRGVFAPAMRVAAFFPRQGARQHELTIGASILSPRRTHGLKLVFDASMLSNNEQRARALFQLSL